MLDEGPGTHSPFDVVAPLLSAGCPNWIPRRRSIFERGEATTFAPCDRDGVRAELDVLDLAARPEAFGERGLPVLADRRS